MTSAYNRFVQINRKMLSEMAIHDKAAFTQLTELAKSKLA